MSKKLFGDKWRIVSPLNEGGQAWTYLVENITNSDGRRYVLKRLKNKKRLDRFEIEISVVQKLNHPNIVRILDHDILDDEPYFVMEYCEAGELDQAKLSGYSVVQKLELFRTICVAVGHAHESQVIHRDIKPANVLFREAGEPVISDFGICFLTEHGLERVTETAEQMGPRFYISPELADGRTDQVSPASDVYSLGKLLYWMFQGRVMNRENFSDSEWDFRIVNALDHSLFHVFELFENSINAEPTKRYGNAQRFGDEVKKTIEVIQNHGHFLLKNLYHRCVFCGKGWYKVTESPYRSASNELQYDAARQLGITPLDHGTQSPNYLQLRILECQWCGNIQMFRLNDKNWKD
jgi:serine/threonine protein kinase